MKKISQFLLASCAALSLVSATANAYDQGHYYKKSKSFSFALIGDTPYGVAPGTEYPPFDRMQAEINSDKSLKWVLHAGDIKGGSSNCSDEMFYDRLERYSHFKRPFILTLGDNEWTDCHRVKAGEYQPLERLQKLREVFYPEVGKTLGKRSKNVYSQAFMPGYEEFPENVLWKKRGVIFSTVHVVGSENGLKAFDANSSATRTEADDLEVERRTNAAIHWINTTFDLAERRHAPGVFIMIHANPVLEFKWLLDRDENGLVTRNGFTEILQTLEARTAAYDKPVILAHGDSHWYRVDKPELPSAVDGKEVFHSNFTRVETFGSSIVHWVKVTVNPYSDEVFQFEQKLVKGND